ncbi:MAG TPA: twin-arginine translocation signal domain-containing protein [Planctomycetes bacterium]|nr:twin-arginine translocation signal domain-containing protein [Planctomycetota bacterium]
MNNEKLSRRTFMRGTSLAAAGAIAGALSGTGCTSNKTSKSKIDTSKILTITRRWVIAGLAKPAWCSPRSA